jgi:hypothetical protein
MLAPNPSQHLESQSVSQRNPSRFHQFVKRSSLEVGECGIRIGERRCAREGVELL